MEAKPEVIFYFVTSGLLGVPALQVTAVGYLTVAGGVMTAVAQAAVESE